MFRNKRTNAMRFVALLFAAALFGFSMPTDAPGATIYDSNVIQRLQLTSPQKQAMRKVIAESRSRRNRIFKKYHIDPNAKPDLSSLQRASAELMANAARERAAARKILNSKQLRAYDAAMKEARRRVMESL